MPRLSSLNPASHPYSNLLYYPGHSYSPIHYLSSALQAQPDDTRLLAFYALDTSRGDMRLCIVLLKYEGDDPRVANMRMSLYPGAVLELSSIGYIRRQIPPPPLRRQQTIFSTSSEPAEGFLTPDTVSFVQVKFRYPMPNSTSAHIQTHTIGGAVTELDVNTDMEDDDEDDQSQNENQRGWCRSEKDWGSIVMGKQKEAFEAAVEERLSDFLELME